MFGYIAIGIVLLGIGALGGWLYAHNVIAKECRVFGAFYVGHTTYKCVAIERRAEEQ